MGWGSFGAGISLAGIGRDSYQYATWFHMFSATVTVTGHMYEEHKERPAVLDSRQTRKCLRVDAFVCKKDSQQDG